MSRPRAAAALAFFVYGACALIAQLLCLQELLLIFAGYELFLGFSLAAWMAWVGLGSWLARRQPSVPLGALAGWAIPLLIANLMAIRLTKCVFGFGMLIGLLPMLMLTVVCLAPIGLAVGALFTWGCERSSARGGCGVGEAYLWDTLGAAVGGILYSALLAGRVEPHWTVVALAAPAAMVTVGLLPPHKRPLGLAVLVLAGAFAASALPGWTRRLQWRGYTLLAERTSRYSHLALAQTGSLTSLFENGLISAHVPDPAAYEELVHWPLLAHPAPRRILIIGGGASGSLTEILKHPVAQVDDVELDPAVMELLKPALGARDRASLDDPRVRFIHQDGRRWLAQTSERYDVILLQLPEPLNAQINRLYTLESFQLIRRRLAPSGLLAFTIPSSENYLSPETLYFNASLYQTLKAAFTSVEPIRPGSGLDPEGTRRVELVAGDPLLLLASPDDVRLELPLLLRRYQERRLRTSEVVPSYFPIKLDEQRRALLLSQLTATRLTGINRDFVPVCYAYAWRVWLAKFVSPAYFLGLLGLIGLVGCLLRLPWQRRAALTRAPGPMALFFLGCAGIVYETVLLLAFQAINGYVYWQLGFLFAAFMLGLALGSWRSVRRLPALTAHHAHQRLRALLLITGLEGLALVWLLPALQHLPSRLPALVPVGALLLITGLWLGLAFPLATRLSSPQRPSDVAGMLYAADLWGAGLGAFFTGAFLVPLLGLLATVGAAGLVLLAAAWRLPPHRPAVTN